MRAMMMGLAMVALRGGGKTNAAMYQAEATITMAARDGKAFMELVDAGGWTKQVAKPRSKRGQRKRTWKGGR